MMSKWRDVPMPPRVAALPRDKRGFPVPWISDWTSGEFRPAGLSAPHLGFLTLPAASCTCTVGEGEPDLGALCVKRQITGMIERLCDVCGEFIPPGPIYFLGGDMGLKEGVIVDVPISDTGFRECGLHLECALYSAQVCPGLTTKGSKVKVLECRAYLPVPELTFAIPGGSVGTKFFESFHDDQFIRLLGTGRAALTAVFAHPIDPTVTPVDEWVGQQLRQGVPA